MRVFAAVPLPPDAMKDVEAVMTVMRSRYPRLKYVRPQGIHVTLHFFGELEEGAVRKLQSMWKDPALARAQIPASLEGVGCFPESGNPRVIWMGIEKGGAELEGYAGLFESRIGELGYQPDPRGFTPHITIARNQGDRVDGEWLRRIVVADTAFSFTECVLFQSVLKPSGAEYIPLARVGFSGGPNAGG